MQKEREERVRRVREHQEEERKKKLEELRAHVSIGTRISTFVEILKTKFRKLDNKNRMNCILLYKFLPFVLNFDHFSIVLAFSLKNFNNF